MHHQNKFRFTFGRVWGLIVVTLLGNLTSLSTQPIDEAARQKLETILGSSISEWRITRYSGAADDYQLVEKDGRPVLIAGPNGTYFHRLEKVSADTEVTVRLRLAAAGGEATTFEFTPGLKKPHEAGAWKPLFLSLHVYEASEQELVSCTMTAPLGQTQAITAYYAPRSLPKSYLHLPEMVRARVEHEAASVPSLHEHWLTLRCVLRRKTAQMYLDGYLLRDASGAGIEPEGYIWFAVYHGTQLASVRIRSIPPEDPIFETVPIGHLLNTGEIAGDRVLRDSLSKPGEPIRIGDVPFILPEPDGRGNDHIDVGRSWMRFGLLEGAVDPWEGEFPRWRGMVKKEPGRISFRVRNGQYSRLHLLAACDGERDSIPLVTAQFYRESAGHPLNFSAEAPIAAAKSFKSPSLPVRLARGTKAHLHLVTIPLEPEGLASFSDLDGLTFELTKEVRIYRAFPDPCYYSMHGAGLPSGVHVYAMTLERPAVEVDFQPDRFAHIWTAPERPSYTIRCRNNTPKERETHLQLSTLSQDGTEKTSQRTTLRVPAGGGASVTFPLELKRYGYHEARLHIRDDQGIRTETRSLAYLHPDTRERGGWEEGKGSLFGMWDWNGGHGTPSGLQRLKVAIAAGIESSFYPILERKDGHGSFTAEEMAYAEHHGMLTHFLAYQFHPGNKDLLGVEFDASKPDAMKDAVVAAVKKSPMATPSRLNKPQLAVFYGEPLLGPVSYMSLPEYYGDPPYQMTEEEQRNYQRIHDEFVIAASAMKQEWPNAKCFLPWGIATFPIPFLRHSKEATALMDGPAVDQTLFERLPEMQMHQVSFASTLWQFKQEWIKAGKPWPTPLITIEGGGLASPATPGGLTQQQEADHSIRSELLLSAFGVTRHLGWPSLFRCAGAWGEQHYGSGLCERLPLLSPKIAYSAHATMTRQLNRMNYVKTVDTGSASVFCLQFRHYQTAKLLHVLWTLRGKRPVTLEQGSEIRGQKSEVEGQGSDMKCYDSMDNEMDLNPLVLTTSPCYVWGFEGDVKISLGVPDHSDARPSKISQRTANLGDGTWKISEERDDVYENVHLEFIKKFPGKISIQAVAARKEFGARALSVHLHEQEKERKTMPFYTTLVPSKPIILPGKPSHLGLWVRAASDWGRFVYALRDANGERWISVGKKGEWNVDDVHSWSAFCFDGWRYLRFELPGNTPWDCYREAGTSFWGYYGEGDGIVDMPLSLEKIIVERRTHVIKVDELLPANPKDVLLADLYAEYEKSADMTEEAVRLSRLRMPVPKDPPAIGNPKPIQR